MKSKSNPFLPATSPAHAVKQCIALGLGLAWSIPSTHAADWVGDTSQDWNNALNWSGDVAPTGNFNINSATAGVYPVISAASSFTPVDLFVGNGAGQTGQLDQATGTLALANTGTSGNWMFVGTNGGTGTYNLTGDGSLAVGKLWVGGFVYGENGSGTATINTTGTVTANSTDDFSGWGQYQTSVSVGWGATGNGTLNLQNGTLNSPNRAIYVGSWGATGALNQSGGTINSNGLTIGKWFSNTTTPSSVNVSGGTLNTAWISLAAAGNGGDVNKGVINVSGTGIVNSEGDVIVAQGGAAASYGEINIATGGTLNVATTTERWMIVNQWDTAQGRVNVNGGTLNLNANTDIRFSPNGNTGASSVTLNSGAITGGTTSVIDLNRAGGASSNNALNLNGGTLTIGQVITTSDNGTATVNFNGGILKATGDSANFVDLGGAGQSAKVLAGGAVIDTNGHNVTVTQALVDGGGDGGLTKNGAGTLTLAGNNTYTGATIVNAGTLFVTGALGTSAISIADGATVAGNASVSGDLDFASGATILFSTTNTLTVAGTVTFDSFGIANLVGLDNSVEAGTYTLINGTVDFTNVINVGLANAVDLGGGKSAYLQQGSLQVVVIPEPGAALLGSLGMLALLRRRR